MATYEYRCPACGVFAVARPLGTAAPEAGCTTCGRAAGRVYSAPHVGRLPSAHRGALARAEASAGAPAVVDRVPPGRRLP